MGKATAIVFDLDGTLLDTARDFALILNQLLSENDRPPLPYRVIRSSVSNGANALVTLGFGTHTEDQKHQQLLQRLLTLYAENLTTQTRFFPGMAQLLKRLEQRQIPWGIVTNKPRQYTLPLLEQMSIRPPGNAIVCPEDVSRPKPDPEPMLMACRILNCHPQHTLCVGDHHRDIESGKAAGMPTVAALYGYVTTDEKPREWLADHYIKKVTELDALLGLTINDS